MYLYSHTPEPVCSVIDSWARGIVPQVSGATEEDTTTHPPLGTSSAEDEVQCTMSSCTHVHVHANHPKTAVYHLLVALHTLPRVCVYVCL